MMIIELFGKFYQRRIDFCLVTMLILLVGIYTQEGFTQSSEPQKQIELLPGITDVTLAQEWWDFMELEANTTNPTLDPTGSSCHTLDFHNVTFLYGWTDPSPAERTCEIEFGNYIYFAHGFECNAEEYKIPANYESVMDCVNRNDQEQMGNNDLLLVDLDGERRSIENGINNGFNFTKSPDLFEVTFPEYNPLWGVKGKELVGAKTYYILEKLPKGNHTLIGENRGIAGDPPESFAWAVKYNLIVK